MVLSEETPETSVPGSKAGSKKRPEDCKKVKSLDYKFVSCYQEGYPPINGLRHHVSVYLLHKSSVMSTSKFINNLLVSNLIYYWSVNCMAHIFQELEH